MERRAVLKIVALTALSQKLNALPGAAMNHLQAPHEATAYTLKFFTDDESLLLDQLMEMIIPADDHSPGAHAAQTNLFADLMVASSSGAIKKQWQDGIRLIREDAVGSSLAEALHRAAANERKPQNRSGSVLRVAETDDGQRLLHFRDGYTQRHGIHRQHVRRGLSGMYSSRTSRGLIPPRGYSSRQSNRHATSYLDRPVLLEEALAPQQCMLRPGLSSTEARACRYP